MRDDRPAPDGDWEDEVPDGSWEPEEEAWEAEGGWAAEDVDAEDGGGVGETARAAVPVILRSEYSGEAFTTCLVCRGDLAEAEFHIVEKLIRGGEAVMEMALCGACADAMSRECSEASLEILREVQAAWAQDAHGEDPAQCAGCGKFHGAGDAFVVAGSFLSGYELVRSLTVCETCHERVQRRLSRATRERFGEFVRDHFPGVPENLDAPIGFGRG